MVPEALLLASSKSCAMLSEVGLWTRRLLPMSAVLCLFRPEPGVSVILVCSCSYFSRPQCYVYFYLLLCGDWIISENESIRINLFSCGRLYRISENESIRIYLFLCGRLNRISENESIRINLFLCGRLNRISENESIRNNLFLCGRLIVWGEDFEYIFCGCQCWDPVSQWMIINK